MVSKVSRAKVRAKKHRRLRNHLSGTAATPRLAVFRSNNHMYAQIIDDTVGKTLVSASTTQKDVKAELEKTNNVDAAAYPFGGGKHFGEGLYAQSFALSHSLGHHCRESPEEIDPDFPGRLVESAGDAQVVSSSLAA